MTPGPISRVHSRIRIRCWLTLLVNQSQRKIWARALDISGAGATVASLVPLSVGSLVRMRSRIDLLAGQASVRYCRRQGLLYRIGLEFNKPVSARF